MLWHRRLGHINAQSVKKLAEEKGTGMVVKDTDFSVSNCDTCALAKSKQQNHPKVARIDRDHNDGNDDTFLDLESSSIALGTQEMPETEADDEPDTDDSESGGTISNVDEESDSDIDLSLIHI